VKRERASERERESERESARERERARERETLLLQREKWVGGAEKERYLK
jgi:hypothetical protein